MVRNYIHTEDGEYDTTDFHLEELYGCGDLYKSQEKKVCALYNEVTHDTHIIWREYLFLIYRR